MPTSNCETCSQFCNDLGSNIQYFAGPVLTLNGQITASDYEDILGSQVVRVLYTFPSTITQLKYHQTTVVSFRKQGDKQIPSIISQTTRRRVVQYSTRDYSELT